MSLSHKVDLLDRMSRGQSVASVGRLYGVNKSTVRYIRKNENAIRECVAASTVLSTEMVTHIRDVHIERIEKALSVWIEECAEKHALKCTSHSRKGDVYLHSTRISLARVELA